jgi:hypothetical protein
VCVWGGKNGMDDQGNRAERMNRKKKEIKLDISKKQNKKRRESEI